jgi:hypothetical protein
MLLKSLLIFESLLNAAVEELSGIKEEPSENVLSRVSWQKEEAVKEPYVGSFRNLLLYNPGTYSFLSHLI